MCRFEMPVGLKKFREYQKEEKSLKEKNTWWFF
jgi:hypothetical protein